MISIACSNNPFKLETDEDEIILFSFLGQVRDRLLYVLNDPRERAVPSIMEWHLSECDINKDIEISDMTQHISHKQFSWSENDTMEIIIITINANESSYIMVVIICMN